MPPNQLDSLTRRKTFGNDEVVVLRPGIALVMYSGAQLAQVMSATADVLEAYLNFVPSGAISASYVPPPDEYAPDGFAPFDASSRNGLLAWLRAGADLDEDEGCGFELTASPDGQAGDFGVRFGGIDFAADDDADEETSILQLSLPWNVLDSADGSMLMDFIERAAGLFPFCSGNAGMSFNYTVGYTTAAADEMQKLLPRFLGFDSTFGGGQLRMRGKSPPAHWLNLLDAGLVDALGGEAQLRSTLRGCEVRNVGGGLLIRAAKYPPVVDVNRLGRDIGLLPMVARALRPVRMDAHAFTPMPDEDRGAEWLARFDDLPDGDWDNG